MSVASGRTGVTVNELSDTFMALPRNTLSAVSGHRHARGLDAILLNFDRKTQLALRALSFDRLELEARKRAMLERLAAENSTRAPDMLISLNSKILDNDANLRRLAGSAATLLLDALKDPEIVNSLQLEMPTEEDAAAEDGESARVWRRRLDTHRPSRSDAPYRHTGHDSPSVTGDRDLHNILATADEDGNLSYYQRQQKKYGRAASRRGSTSIAGVLRMRACAAYGRHAARDLALTPMHSHTHAHAPLFLSSPLSVCRRVGWHVGWLCGAATR